MKTFSTKASDIKRQWYLIDASDQILGRVATQIARLLRGKHKPIFTPHLDTGDFVVVINAAKVKVTGGKVTQKTYIHHSGYPGGFKSTTFDKVIQTHPDRVIRWAVEGMLPKNSLGEAMLKKLKVYAGPTHPHAAQLGSGASIVETETKSAV
ncbi:MAG: 50S ribosomal protein L13 [Dehalococcoidia bacterium]|nr:ribosomal protein L13 [Dehalococcoidia bacterium]MBF8304165.1 ribosomal protein [Dehalococcoidia bacterium]MDO8635259.1 50S ribosomal protein L13 [Dehalococcoidia bacterium]